MIIRFAAALPLLMLSQHVLAGFLAVPEPETLTLLGVGAVALVIARMRGRK